MEHLGKVSHLRRGGTVYRQDEPAHSWYCLVEGAARKSVIMTDGRRQIVTFLFAGDLFGFGHLGVHPFSVEVTSQRAVVAQYSRTAAERLAENDPEVSRLVREITFDVVARLQSRMVLRGCSGALEKIAGFLVEMFDRTNCPGSVIDLPMSRYEIADYLSMSVETVSRSLTAMRRQHLIERIGNRRIRVIDERGLRILAPMSA